MTRWTALCCKSFKKTRKEIPPAVSRRYLFSSLLKERSRELLSGSAPTTQKRGGACHAAAFWVRDLARAHPPTPLPLISLSKRGNPAATGGGRLFYTSHFKGGFHPPLKPLCSRSGLSVPLGGARGVLVPSGHRPGPTEAAAETEAPPRRRGFGGVLSPVGGCKGGA